MTRGLAPSTLLRQSAVPSGPSARAGFESRLSASPGSQTLSHMSARVRTSWSMSEKSVPSPIPNAPHRRHDGSGSPPTWWRPCVRSGGPASMARHSASSCPRRPEMLWRLARVGDRRSHWRDARCRRPWCVSSDVSTSCGCDRQGVLRCGGDGAVTKPTTLAGPASTTGTSSSSSTRQATSCEVIHRSSPPRWESACGPRLSTAGLVNSPALPHDAGTRLLRRGHR